ncbi:MAG TPA: RagB/SusD family nutrient uptake outer membrane protein [Puia sp.]
MVRRPGLLLIISVVVPAVFGWESCKKSGFLTTKENASLVVPNTIESCQALLDNDVVMNGFGNSGYPYLGEAGSDDYYSTPAQLSGYTVGEQQAVAWLQGINPNVGLNDWSLAYRVVYTANQAMAGLPVPVAAGKQAAWNNVKASALFFRSFAYYQLLQIFAPAYDSTTAASDPGICLRYTADVNEKFTRASVQTSYNQIVSDLDSAAALFPTDSVWFPTRPSRAAVYGLLARVWLCVRDYHRAFAYSDSCLRLQGALMQYDTISTAAFFPFYRFNPEVIFSAAYLSSGPTAIRQSSVDSLLYRSYAANDLRSRLFFKGGDFFFGRYDQSGYGFCGLATDELYLTRAECSARLGNFQAAMDDLNKLLTTRWAAGTYSTLTATNTDDALQQILTERRKELLFRGLRWTDLRRLNKEQRWAITLNRNAGGATCTLPPNDRRYVYPIPDSVLSMNPGMSQNLR